MTLFNPNNATLFGLKCRHPPVLNSTDDFELPGTPLRSIEFIQRVLLDTYLLKLADNLNSISAIEDSQICYSLLSKCCSASRVTNLMRTIDHQTFRPFATRFDGCVLDSLQKIIATHRDHNHIDQTALPTRLGGMGLRRTTDHLTSYFVASVARVASVEVPSSDADILSQSRLPSIVDNTTYENLLVRLNQFDRARCLTVAQPHASAWLHVIPNKADSINAQRLQMQPILPSRRPLWVARSNLPTRRLRRCQA
ncbi:hypothetical protein GJ496_003351 [Pomphorhynchus laevis]|nr:hypothetical protein GJ496_003351 [Pomphorhynchus laevis]